MVRSSTNGTAWTVRLGNKAALHAQKQQHASGPNPHGRGATVRRGQVNVAIDKLMAGRVSRPVTMYVRVRVIVPAAAGCRQATIGAERAIRHERKRRRDRQTGRKALGLQMEINYTRPIHARVSEILVSPTQQQSRVDKSQKHANCAYLVAFG